MSRLVSIISRIAFIISFILAGLAVWERLAVMMGYTLLRGQYYPWRLLEYAAVALLFVVALQLREIRLALTAKSPR
jgi:hypothetical protein